MINTKTIRYTYSYNYSLTSDDTMIYLKQLYCRILELALFDNACMANFLKHNPFYFF